MGLTPMKHHRSSNGVRAVPKTLLLTMLSMFAAAPFATADDVTPPAGDPTTATKDAKTDTDDATKSDEDDEGVVDSAKKTLDNVKESVDENETAKEYSAGLLKVIYDVAEYLEFSAFHWVAFAVMATGVVSFALQLVLGKLIVLTTGGFSLTAILSDALGLVVSAVGLVLTTQAAVQNSAFAQSAAAVLSAAGVGVIAGFLFYLWGQRQEIEAAKGRARS